MAAFAAVFSLCANAQDWKGNTVADGTFYLYNIGSGQWLCGGNNWGTRASVNSTGDIDFQIAASGTGYTLDSQISNGGESHFSPPLMPTLLTWTAEPMSGLSPRLPVLMV